MNARAFAARHLTSACAALVWAASAGALAQSAAALRQSHSALAATLHDNPYGRPLTLTSNEAGERIEGDVHAQLDQPFQRVAPALQGTAQWCEILFLHLNVKSCRGARSESGETLGVGVGTKHDQPLEQAYRLDFAYSVVASQPDYLKLRLGADEGPLGTHDYRIEVEVVALDATRSFLRMAYSYRVGFAARVAMQAYLATLGRDKVGFSEVGRAADGQPRLIGGPRGVVERNTMRYYLAIEAYLASLHLPPPRQFEQRLADWQAGVDRYPRQLHELDRADYFALKHSQRRRQAEARVR